MPAPNPVPRFALSQLAAAARCSGLSLALACVIAPASWAQSGPANPPADNEPQASQPDRSSVVAATDSASASTSTATTTATTTHLQRVSVTGARAEAPLKLGSGLALTARETPQSISTLGRERMELQSMFNIDQVMRNITGVNVTFYDTQRPLYFARGFQITDFQVDGIPTYSGSTNQEYDTALYERIEVVRGANGLLSGAGLPSATVNLVRKRPGRELAASVTTSAGSWNFGRVQTDLNLPLTEQGGLRARVVAAYQDSDSHLDRYHEKKLAWLATVEADLGDATVVTLGHQVQDNKPVGSIWGTIPRFAADGSLANLPRSISFAPEWTRWQRNSGTSFLNLEHRFGASWSAKLALARTSGDVDSLRVYALGYPNKTNGAGVSLLAGVGLADDVRDNIDAQLSGGFELWGRRHDLVLGYNQNVIDANTIVLSSVASWNYTIPDLATWHGVAPIPVYSRTGANRVATTDQRGVYGSVRWRLGDAVSLITGARVSDWKTYTRNFSTTGAYTGITGAYEVKNEVTPYVGAVVEVSDDWSVYASHTGIFNPQNLQDRNNQPLAPVGGSNAEAGLKGSLLDKRLNVSVALYRTEQNNRGVRDSTQPDGSLPGGASAYVGVDGTRASGFEVEVSGFLRPGWQVGGGYTYTRTQRQATDLIYANLPDHYLQLNSSVQLPGALSAVTVGGSLTLQSKVVGLNIPSPSGPQTVTQGGFGLASLYAQWRINRQLTASFNVTNLFDKTYWATLDYPNYGPPRNASVSLRWSL